MIFFFFFFLISLSLLLGIIIIKIIHHIRVFPLINLNIKNFKDIKENCWFLFFFLLWNFQIRQCHQNFPYLVISLLIQITRLFPLPFSIVYSVRPSRSFILFYNFLQIEAVIYFFTIFIVERTKIIKTQRIFILLRPNPLP